MKFFYILAFLIVGCASPNNYKGTFQGYLASTNLFAASGFNEETMVLVVTNAVNLKKTSGDDSFHPEFRGFPVVLVNKRGPIKVVAGNVSVGTSLSIKGNFERGSLRLSNGEKAVESNNRTNILWSGRVLRTHELKIIRK